MSGQLTICFSSPESPGAPAPTAPVPPQPEIPPPERDGPSEAPAPALPLPAGRDAELPALRLFAGYEMYRDGSRTVIRKPGEARWGATVRTGPTTHRFVGAGPDPAALWSLAAREAARAPASPGPARA